LWAQEAPDGALRPQATHTPTATVIDDISAVTASDTATATTVSRAPAAPVELHGLKSDGVPPDKTELQNARIKIKSGAPEGFEALEGPAETAVDLHFGGLKLGVFRAVYTPHSILFSSPDEIVSKVPALDPESSKAVKQALTGELPTNADRICGPVPKAGCGTSTPDIAEVIFNQDKFSAELFINPSLLLEQDTHTDKVLPPAPDIVSGVHSISGGLVGTPGEKQNYSLMTNSTLASGDKRLNFTGITALERSRLQNLTASVDRWGLESTLGFFDSRPLQLLAQTSMTGLSVGTSLNTNLAYRNTTGSRISIFLPQRSYVSLIFNNVIYSTDFYEAGNQVLDTDTLPDGAYELTIRMVDTDGKQMEEKRFFTKNFQIPPEGEPIYFGQLGTVRDTSDAGFLPDSGSGFISSFGVLSRYGESTGLALDGLVIKNRIYAEAASFLLLPPNNQLRASLLISSGKDMGLGLNYQGLALEKRLSFGANARNIIAGQAYEGSEQLIPIKTDARQVTANAGYQITDLANISFILDYNQSGNTPHRVSYGPSLRWDLWREGESNLSLGLDASQSNEGQVQNLMIRYTKRIGSWGLTGDGVASRGSAAASGGRSANISRSSRLTWNDDATPGKMTIFGTEIRQDSTSNNYLADLDHRGNLGNLKLLGSQTRSNHSQRTIYSGNAGFGIAHTLEDITWTGAQQQSSGVIIKTVGEAHDIPMKVIVDGSQRSEFLTGESTALFLAPYQSYKVSISPVESSPIDYDGSVKTITLYPGNVLPLNWEIASIHVLLGRAVTPKGEPVANAKLEESGNLVMTDDEGLFQTELKTVDHITLFRAAEEPFKGVTNSTSHSGEPDLFTVMPPAKNTKASITDREKRELIIDLFGDVGDVSPNGLVAADDTAQHPASTATDMPAAIYPPEASAVDPADISQLCEVPVETTATALRPAFRCRITLPKAKEVNNVIMYSEPLVCHPIPLEEAKELTGPVTASEAGSEAVDETQAKTGDGNSPSERETREDAAQVWEGGDPATIVMPSGGGEAIQLGAYRSESQAMETWKDLQALSPIFSTIEPRVEMADLPKKGRYYRLRITGFLTSQDSSAFCRELKTLGRECVLVKSWPNPKPKAMPKTGKASFLEVPESLKHEPVGDSFVLPEPK